MHRLRPVAVAIENGAADAAVENAVERDMVRLRPPLAHEVLSVGEAADAQPFLVCRAATEAAIVWRVRFLEAFHFFASLLSPQRHRDHRDGLCVLCASVVNQILFANARRSGKKSWKRRSSSARESIR